MIREEMQLTEKYEISHITTGDILLKAMNAGMITEAEGNVIWLDMIRKRRMLPTMTFSEYLANYHCPATQKS